MPEKPACQSGNPDFLGLNTALTTNWKCFSTVASSTPRSWLKKASRLPPASLGCKSYSYFEKGCRKNVHASIPKDNMGYDQYIVLDDCSCRTYCCFFPLALANICPWPSVPFFQISLKNRALKTTHNTFRDCRVHFFRQ